MSSDIKHEANQDIDLIIACNKIRTQLPDQIESISVDNTPIKANDIGHSAWIIKFESGAKYPLNVGNTYDDLKWTRLSMLQIIKLQAAGVFDRQTIEVKNSDAFTSLSDFIIYFKIRAPCVLFTDSVISMNKPPNSLETLNINHVRSFNKWKFPEIATADIKVWYGFYGINQKLLFVDNNLITCQNIEARFLHENGNMYKTKYRFTIADTLSSTVKVSTSIIGKSTLKVGNLDDSIFSAEIRLLCVTLNKIVSSFVDQDGRWIYKIKKRKSKKKKMKTYLQISRTILLVAILFLLSLSSKMCDCLLTSCLFIKKSAEHND